MNGYLLDTNVVSELRRPQKDPAVAAWFASIGANEAFLSALVIGEVRKGITRLEVRDAPQASRLSGWLTELEEGFADRILPVDARVAERWGRIDAVRPVPVIDGLIAATAMVHDLTLATRNVRDVADTGVRVLDPWEPR